MSQRVRATFDAERQEFRLDEPLVGIQHGEVVSIVISSIHDEPPSSALPTPTGSEAAPLGENRIALGTDAAIELLKAFRDGDH